MRKVLALALLTLGYGACAAAADLTIPPGQTYIVTAEQSDLRLDRLIIGDNAQVRFADGVGRWRVEAKQARIGNNVVIDGRGAQGAAGTAGGDFSERAKDCDAGAKGKPGAAGSPGGDGVELAFWWGVESWGSAKLLTDGGAGGRGGPGGHGQDGGKVNRCSGPAGGDGGQGGAGGSGGKAGDVTLSYFDASGKGVAVSERLAVNSGGGQPGAGGSGGAGGAGAEGRFQRTATGDVWFAAGKAGGSGSPGSAGAAGGTGAVNIQTVGAGTRPLWSSEASSITPADRGTVQSLQKQVQALQAGSLPTAGAGDQLQALQDRLQKLEERVKVLEAR